MWFLAAVLIGLVVFEVSMQPTAEDRVLLGLIFVLVAVFAAVLASRCGGSVGGLTRFGAVC